MAQHRRLINKLISLFAEEMYDRKEKLIQRLPYLFTGHEECPKNSFIRAPDGEPSLNYLCSGLQEYFAHIDPYMKRMAKQWLVSKARFSNISLKAHAREALPLSTLFLLL